MSRGPPPPLGRPSNYSQPSAVLPVSRSLPISRHSVIHFVFGSVFSVVFTVFRLVPVSVRNQTTRLRFRCISKAAWRPYMSGESLFPEIFKLLRAAPLAGVLTTLDTLSVILNNALSKGGAGSDGEKYLTLRGANATLRSRVLDAPGGANLLACAGFYKITEDGQVLYKVRPGCLCETLLSSIRIVFGPRFAAAR